MSRYPAISGARLELSRANRLHTVLRHDSVVYRRTAAPCRDVAAAGGGRGRVNEVALPQTLQRSPWEEPALARTRPPAPSGRGGARWVGGRGPARGGAPRERQHV